MAAPQRITVALFGVTVLDDVTYDAIDKSETSWTIERDLSRGTQLKLSLVKAGRAAWWMSLLNDDTDGRVPECEDRMNPDLAYSIASHLEGQGDVRLAFKYYKAAADGRHALSASWVGNLYIDGNADAGIPADTEKALQYLTIAAEEGNIEAMYQIGHAFHYGVGTLSLVNACLMLYLILRPWQDRLLISIVPPSGIRWPLNVGTTCVRCTSWGICTTGSMGECPTMVQRRAGGSVPHPSVRPGHILDLDCPGA